MHALAQAQPERSPVAAAASPKALLDGVPVTIKENIATQGDPTAAGHRRRADCTPALADAPPAARLREAGAVMVCQDHHARLRHVVLGPVHAFTPCRATRGT